MVSTFAELARTRERHNEIVLKIKNGLDYNLVQRSLLICLSGIYILVVKVCNYCQSIRPEIVHKRLLLKVHFVKAPYRTH